MGHMRQRSKGSWEIRVSAGFTGSERRVITRTIRGTKAEAARAMRELEMEVGRGDSLNGGSTVAEMIEMSIITSKRHWSPTTLAEYTRVGSALPANIAILPLWKVRPLDLDFCYGQMADAGINVHTIRRTHELLSSSFSNAVKWGWISRNPCEHATPPPRPRSQRAPADPSDVAKLMLACPPTLALWLRLAFITGSRRGEICALKWQDINLERQELIVRRNVVYTAASGLVIKGTKEGTVKVVALDKTTVTALEAHLETEMAVTGPISFSDRWVFTHTVGGEQPWRPDYVTMMLGRLMQRTGVRFKIHEIRHATATELLDAGFAMSTVKERLGHDREETTRNFYSHAVKARDRQAADHLSTLLG